MSRADKQFHLRNVVGTSKEEKVRLFAFANTRPGYQVVFSPEAPIIVLKTKKPDKEQHPAKQWEALSDCIFTSKPNTTHAMYVADTTTISSLQHDLEMGSGASVGPLLRQLGNVLSKLNPHNAILVAAGVSAYLALKYILVGEKPLGHKDRLVKRVILVCPTPLSSLQLLVEGVLRRPQDTQQQVLPEVVVMLKDAKEVDMWTTWLKSLRDDHHRLSMSSVTADLEPGLFQAIAREAEVHADGTVVDLQSRLPTPRVYRIDMVLSKQTKQVEQLVSPSPLNTLGCDDTAGESMSETGSDGASVEEGGVPSAHESCDTYDSKDSDGSHHCNVVAYGVAALQHWRDPVQVAVEGRVLNLDTGLVATTEGCVLVENLGEVVAADAALAAHVARRKGAAVCLITSIVRDATGRTRLKCCTARGMTRSEEKSSHTLGSLAELPSYTISDIPHSYGALLVRGRKCALVRDVSEPKTYHGLRIPAIPHSECGESSMDCAIRALCEGCDVSRDNFYQPGFIPPVTCYVTETEDTVRCVTLYLFLAGCPPPRGPMSDAVEDEPEEEEPYDWVSYARAMVVLQSEHERDAVTELRDKLQKALLAGLYKPVKGCGMFGDSVSCSGELTDAMMVGSTSLEGLELMIVICPGDSEQSVVADIKERMGAPSVFVFDATTTTEMLDMEAIQAVQTLKTLFVYLVDDVDIDSFCEEQLIYLTEERGATARLLTVLLPETSRRIGDMQSEDVGTRAWYMHRLLVGARSSDAILTLEPPEKLSDVAWAVLAACCEANADLSVFYGIEALRMIDVEGHTSTVATAETPMFHRLNIATESDTPLSPTSVGRLTRRGSLQGLYQPGKCFVLFLQGSLWIASRKETPTVAIFDGTSMSLHLERDDPCCDAYITNRRSSLTLLLWATAAAAAEVETHVRALFSQMQRDSEQNRESLQVPGGHYPQWEE